MSKPPSRYPKLFLTYPPIGLGKYHLGAAHTLRSRDGEGQPKYYLWLRQERGGSKHYGIMSRDGDKYVELFIDYPLHHYDIPSSAHIFLASYIYL